MAIFKNGTKTKTAGTSVLSRNSVVLPPSIIGPRTRIQGTIGGAGPLTIRGEVEGKIAIRDRLNVAPGGKVHAEVEAERVELQGRIDGVIRAHEWVRIVAPGRLEGDAISPQAQVGLGAIIRGGLLIRSTGRRRGV